MDSISYRAMFKKKLHKFCAILFECSCVFIFDFEEYVLNNLKKNKIIIGYHEVVHYMICLL